MHVVYGDPFYKVWRSDQAGNRNANWHPLVNHFSSDVLFVVGGSIKIFLAEFKSPVFSEVCGTLNLQIFSEIE